MANSIELLNREDAIKVVGVLSRFQRILVITGGLCDRLDLWIRDFASDFDSIVVRKSNGDNMICLIVPEFCVPQAESDIFNKTFMHFKMTWSNDFDNWNIEKGFKAVPTTDF